MRFSNAIIILVVLVDLTFNAENSQSDIPQNTGIIKLTSNYNTIHIVPNLKKKYTSALTTLSKVIPEFFQKQDHNRSNIHTDPHNLKSTDTVDDAQTKSSNKLIDTAPVINNRLVDNRRIDGCADQKMSTLLTIINSIDFHRNQLLSRFGLNNIRNTNDMIEVGFEKPDLKSNGIYPSGNPPELTADPEEIFEGKQAIRICLDKNRSPVEYRTEFILNADTYSRKFVELEYNKEYWIGFVILLDKDYKIPRLRDILFQIHGTPDLLLGENYRNPLFTLSVSGDLDNDKLSVNKPHWTISILGDDRKITPIKENRYPTKILAAIAPAEDDIGYWVKWVLHFRYTYNPNGFMQIWKDGKIVFYEDKIRTAFNDAIGAYIKIGSYKWSWRKTNHYPVITPPVRVSYIDSLRIAQGANRYNDVAPAQ